jgi:hypothetical protein
MINLSKNGKQYINFNWKLYASVYPLLTTNGFNTYDELWWHFVNIGEESGYIYFDVNDYDTYLERYKYFNCEKYITFIKNKDDINLIDNGFKTKEDLWWHYITTNKYQNYPDVTDDVNVIYLKPKKILYYFIHHTSSDSIRTGIQIVTIYLAKELLNLTSRYNFEIIFVKWDFNYNALVPCSQEDIHYLFHLFWLNMTYIWCQLNQHTF